eukprot:UN07497
MGFYFFEPEIIPANVKGVFRFHNGKAMDKFPNTNVEVRAVIESQFMNIRSHAEKLGLEKSKRIIATGGASKIVPFYRLSAIFWC